MKTKVINEIALVNSDSIIIKDIASAIDFAIAIKYKLNCNKIAINKKAVIKDFLY